MKKEEKKVGIQKNAKKEEVNTPLLVKVVVVGMETPAPHYFLSLTLLALV